ncbi:proline-rich protein 15-like [Pteronotus mesoamericanus]|uniref:proline-rich protein 15-like n=1 Tax=Pteronotus mesoamericanus TaxID=1884717 RepID=UPI0023ECBB87|nr:proline-rich protein 15-like [Pteronotus parnellii mesoamericanus]
MALGSRRGGAQSRWLPGACRGERRRPQGPQGEPRPAQPRPGLPAPPPRTRPEGAGATGRSGAHRHLGHLGAEVPIPTHRRSRDGGHSKAGRASGRVRFPSPDLGRAPREAGRKRLHGRARARASLPVGVFLDQASG